MVLLIVHKKIFLKISPKVLKDMSMMRLHKFLGSPFNFSVDILLKAKGVERDGKENAEKKFGKLVFQYFRRLKY